MLHTSFRLGIRKSVIGKHPVATPSAFGRSRRRVTSAGYRHDWLPGLAQQEDDPAALCRWEEHGRRGEVAGVSSNNSISFDPSYLGDIEETPDTVSDRPFQDGQQAREAIPKETGRIFSRHSLQQTAQHILSAEERHDLAQNIQAVFEKAIASNDSEELLQRVWEVSQVFGGMAAIPSTTFIEILRQLDPSDSFLPFRHSYSTRIPKNYTLFANRHRKEYATLQRRRTMYWDIFEARARYSLDVREYAQFLRCARSTWDGRFATTVMTSMISKGVKPDVDCYNLYFESKCWSEVWHPSERQLLRVIPYTRKIRQDMLDERNGKRSVERGIVIRPHGVGERGLKNEVREVFTHMIEGGIMADGKAFGALLTALAREGDLQGVKAVLQKAWDVDVDAIKVDATNPQESDGPTRLPSSSPLYPNQDHLLIIAHAFGSNNDVPTALRVVDHFSRKFLIPVSEAVWAELLEWTFTLSTRRSKRRKTDGAQIGQLSLQTMEHLWHVITSEPYNCQPSLPMYDLIIRSWRRRDCLFSTLKCMLEGLEIDMRNSQRFLARERSACAKGIEDDPVLTELRNESFTAFAYVHQWFRLLLAGQRWLSGRKNSRTLVWERQLLPNVIDMFWRYRDKKGVEYNMKTGLVLLQPV